MLLYPICVYLHVYAHICPFHQRFHQRSDIGKRGFHDRKNRFGFSRVTDQDGMFGSDWLPGTFGEHEGGPQHAYVLFSLVQTNHIHIHIHIHTITITITISILTPFLLIR